MDKTFFSNIDTEVKAYWLGFITTDGCVLGDNRLVINLGVADRGHLSKLLADLGCLERKIYTYLNNKGCEYDSVHINSKEIVRDLKQLGIMNRKTFTVKPWSGPPELMRHYWRGCVDGDGWICNRMTSGKYKNRILGVGFCGNTYMVEGFRDFVASMLGEAPLITPDKTIFKLYVGGIRNPSKLADILYGNAKVFLDRKYLLAQKLIGAESMNNHYTFTKEDVLDLFAQHQKWTEVAKALDIAPSYLRTFRKRFGLPVGNV